MINATRLVHTLRSLRRSPTFTIVAILTLALGIGATTGVVSILDTVLLRDLPYRDSATLATIIERSDKGSSRGPSYPTWKDYREAVGGPVVSTAFIRGRLAILRRSDLTERVVTGYVTPEFFPIMGTPPLMGRTLVESDNAPGASRVAVLSYELWQHKFSGDSNVLNSTINLDSVPTTIVGVMPRGFAYPDFAQAWEPIVHAEDVDKGLQNRGTHADSRTLVRLRAAGDSAAAAAKLSVVERRLASVYPETNANWTGIILWTMHDQTVGSITGTLQVLAAAAALVLLLACANVATLALIRGSARARELAVRAALGAGRERLIGELVAESAVIAAAGCAAGVLLASQVVRFVRQSVAGYLPRANELVVDWRVVTIAIAISVITVLVAGLFPAFRVTRVGVAGALQGGQRGASGGRSDVRIRGGLVALQFALTTVLLVSAGLLLQSFRKMSAVPDDWDKSKIAQASIFPPSPTYDTPTAAAALYDRLRDAARAIPGVQDAAVINHMAGIIPSRVDIPGQSVEESQQKTALYHVVSSEYQKVIGVPMMRGRWFTDADMRAPDVAGFVVNETMASRFFPGGDALGKEIIVHRSSQLRPDLGEPMNGTIIGVVRDIHWNGPGSDTDAEVFVPMTRETWPWAMLVVRSDAPARIAPLIRKAIFNVDPNIPISADNDFSGVQYPTGHVVFGRRELTLAMIGGFGVTALLLAAVGLYGVVAYSVGQRTREFGIRTALGATRAHVARLVLGGAGTMVAIGVVAGLGGAFAAARLIKAMLYDTAPTDPMTYAAVPLLLAIVALVGSWWPTRRAMRVEPTEAIRAE